MKEWIQAILVGSLMVIAAAQLCSVYVDVKLYKLSQSVDV